jgi:hypothetical protein
MNNGIIAYIYIFNKSIGFDGCMAAWLHQKMPCTRGTAPHNLSSDYLVVKLLMSVVYQSALPRPVVKRT